MSAVVRNLTELVLPKQVAVVDDDAEFSEFLSAHLTERSIDVRYFLESAQLLADPQAYGYDFYVVDLMLPGIAGLDLIKVLRLRTNAGILVVSGRLAPEVLDDVLTAGADMYLAKPVTLSQVTLAINAVHRRVRAASPRAASWRVDRHAKQLIAPDGARVDLSQADLDVLACFVQAGGAVVSRESLHNRLGLDTQLESTGGVYAAIYRLRRRIERSTSHPVPLQSVSRVGYCFKGPLEYL